MQDTSAKHWRSGFFSLIGLIVLFLLLYIFLENEVPPVAGWTSEVKVFRKSMGGSTRVVDSESGKVLFTYLPEYDGHVHPISIKKIDDAHWQVVLENPNVQK